MKTQSVRQGSEYEAFAYETFRRVFREFAVKRNDHILGANSKRLREVDVSVRGKVADTDILYIVQAKDYNRPVSIGTVDAFSGVIQDVGASKGFLIGASGFARTIRDYARTLGIELLTIEDINSPRWTATVEIPVVRTRYTTGFNISYSFKGTPEFSAALKERNTREIPLALLLMSFDGGITYGGQVEQIKATLLKMKLDLSKDHEIVFPNGQVKAAIYGCVLDAEAVKLSLKANPEHYLKYVKPSEYRQITNHLTDVTVPVKANFRVDGLTDEVDGTWTRIPSREIPVRPASISFHIEVIPEKVVDVHMKSASLETE